MNISDLKQLKINSQLNDNEISLLSGIPENIVTGIFSDTISNPQYATLLALEQVLVKKEKIPFQYDELIQEPVLIREESSAYQYSARNYEEKDIEELSEYARAELINGKLYMLSAPNRMHQYLITELLFRIKSHISQNKGKCHVYTSPFDVRLFDDGSTVVQPDLLIVCKKDILTKKGCTGAPDWIIEIVSESNSSHDYITKMVQYQKAGVREYWIIDPFQELATVFNFEDARKSEQYTYEDYIPSGVLDDFKVRIFDFINGF